MPLVILRIIIYFGLNSILCYRQDVINTDTLIEKSREFQVCQIFERFVPRRFASEYQATLKIGINPRTKQICN